MNAKRSKQPSTGRRTNAAPVGPPLIREILVTTDFSGQALPAVRYALTLGRKVGAKITLLHVVETASWLSGMELVVLARTDAEVASLARTKLEALANREAKSSGVVTTVVRSGKPFHEIVVAAGEREVDLIVIATHGHTGLKRAWIGSTAERVVRHAQCPVLTVPTRGSTKRTGAAGRFRLERIVVPIDFSSLSKDAVPYATLLAKQFGAEILLLHVVERFPIDAILGRGLMNEVTVPLMKQAEVNLEQMATELAQSTGVKTSAIVRDGSPFENICLAAKSLNADLIVLTTHGYTALKHVWLGSTAERVVRQAPCPVLVVRELK